MARQAPIMNDVRRADTVKATWTKRWSHKIRIKKRLVIGLVVLVLLVGLGAAGYELRHKNSGSATSNDVKVVIVEVSKHYLLPTDETPALATVTDTSKLTTPFFKKSQNGDKVLIYQTNQIAIIYRPKIDRIIAVGPVSIDTPPSATSSKR